MNKSILSGSIFLLLAAFGAGAATLTGVVTSSGGGGPGGAAPVAAAKVVLMGFGGGGGGGQQALDSTTTNAQGRYTFDSVTTGFKQVVTSKTGFQNGQAFANVTTAGGSFTANITMVPTGGGGNTGIVSGTVRAGTSTGTPIANALVVLANAAGGGRQATLDSTRTNAQGQYRFDSVAAVNNFTMRVSATGYNPATNNNVDVNEGDTTVANFVLTAIPGGGRPGSISGTVRKAAGADPIANAMVVLSRGGIGGGRLDSMKTNAEGHYAFDSVAAMDNYIVTVTAAGFQTASNANVDVASNQTSTVDFSLIASGPVPTRGSIIGTVTDNAKKAVAKAQVILSRTGTGGGNGPVDTVETDASGDFAFDSVTALQNYTVTVKATGFQIAVNNNVDVVAGQAALADFILVPSTSVRFMGASEAGFRLADIRGGLTVAFAASPWAGRLSVYDTRGALAYSTAVPAGTLRMSLPGKGGVRFMVLERGGMVERLSVNPAR